MFLQTLPAEKSLSNLCNSNTFEVKEEFERDKQKCKKENIQYTNINIQ